LRRRRGRVPVVQMYIGAVLLLLGIVGAGLYLFATPSTSTHAADENANCTLIVPDQALSAQGLATPYQLVATNRRMGPCHEDNPAQSAFVQGAVIDPASGQISIYNPLVVDRGTQPAVMPTAPKLPANAIVGLWFGFNGAQLTLRGSDGQTTLDDNHCVNGFDGTDFGTVAYCNAQAFFTAANQAITQKKLVPPPLGTGKDGQACPSVRSFTVVDQDQSDNVNTTYLVNRDGQIAQMTANNAATLQNAWTLANASDNRLVAQGVDGALGCTAWTAPDLADPGHSVTAQPLDELQAAAGQQQPVALVPDGDPMVLVDGRPNLDKLNAYRVGVDQPVIQDAGQAATNQYCTNLLNEAPQRIKLDMPFTQNVISPNAAMANNLFTFLAQRFVTTWGPNGLNCQGRLGMGSTIRLRMEGDVTVAATIGDTTDMQGGNGDTNKQWGGGNTQGDGKNTQWNDKNTHGSDGNTQGGTQWNTQGGDTNTHGDGRGMYGGSYGSTHGDHGSMRGSWSDRKG